jgi:hypothetical protein
VGVASIASNRPSCQESELEHQDINHGTWLLMEITPIGILNE